MQQMGKKFYSRILKETITILQQAKAFLTFHCRQKDSVSEKFLEKCRT